MGDGTWGRSLACVAIVLFFIGAVICNAAPPKTQITFVAHGAEGMYAAHDLENAVKRFEKLNPNVEVDLVKAASGWQAYLEQILLRVASGLPVDIITPQPHWPLSTIRYVADLTPYMNRDGLSEKDFLPGSMDAYYYEGKITGLPLAMVLRGSVYNAKILAESGYAAPPGDKWTWDTVREIGRKLTKDTSGDGIPDVYGVHCGGPVRSLMIFPLATQAGGLFLNRFVDPDRSLFDTPPARTALEYFTSFYLEGQTRTNTNFLRGQAAYSMDGYLMPHGQIESQLGHTDVVFFPAPKGPAKGGFQQGVQGVQLMAASPHLEESWRLAKYLATSLDEVKERYRLGQNEPSALVRALPLYHSISQRIPSFEGWMDIAAHPDNTPRYSIRSREVEPLVERMLTTVIEQKQPLQSAIGEIHRLVQIELDGTR